MKFIKGKIVTIKYIDSSGTPRVIRGEVINNEGKIVTLKLKLGEIKLIEYSSIIEYEK